MDKKLYKEGKNLVRTMSGFFVHQGSYESAILHKKTEELLLSIDKKTLNGNSVGNIGLLWSFAVRTLNEGCEDYSIDINSIDNVDEFRKRGIIDETFGDMLTILEFLRELLKKILPNIPVFPVVVGEDCEMYSLSDDVKNWWKPIPSV